MRPTIRKSVKTPAPRKAPSIKRPDDARELMKVRKWVGQALAELKIAREILAKSYAGPEHEALEWAQQFLENALTGKGKAR